MNAQQKRAWLGVITGILCIVGFLILWPIAGPMVATAAFGVFGLNGFSVLIGRKEIEDERDRAIRHRATLGGGMCSYGALCLAMMGIWAWCHFITHQATVMVEVLPTMAIVCGLFVFYFTQSLVVLVLYGRHVEAEHA